MGRKQVQSILWDFLTFGHGGILENDECTVVLALIDMEAARECLCVCVCGGAGYIPP